MSASQSDRGKRERERESESERVHKCCVLTSFLLLRCLFSHNQSVPAARCKMQDPFFCWLFSLLTGKTRSLEQILYKKKCGGRGGDGGCLAQRLLAVPELEDEEDGGEEGRGAEADPGLRAGPERGAPAAVLGPGPGAALWLGAFGLSSPAARGGGLSSADGDGLTTTSLRLL